MKGLKSEGMGWGVAAAFALADAASGRLCLGGVVALWCLRKVPKKSEVWDWGWLPPSPWLWKGLKLDVWNGGVAAAFALADAACLGGVVGLLP